MKRKWIAGAIATLATVIGVTTTTLSPIASAQTTSRPKPTIVLVHGAWADASGWTPVVERLQEDGYTVVAPANPLRGLTSDSAYIASVLSHIDGPIVLVGHSYGGAVITNAAVGNPNVKALVYVAGWGPDQGESLQDLLQTPAAKTIPPLPTDVSTYTAPDGSTAAELTIDHAQYSKVFLDDELPKSEADAFAAEQRPFGTDAATQASGTPAWKTIPSWYAVAKGDRAIAPALERMMAARMHAHTVEVDGPHLVMFTNPRPITRLIEQAAIAG